MIPFDIKIDDKITNLDNSTTKILFNAWHNKTISEEELKDKNVIRVYNWKDIENILL